MNEYEIQFNRERLSITVESEKGINEFLDMLNNCKAEGKFFVIGREIVNPYWVTCVTKWK